MPNYEYQCSDCQHTTTANQKIDDRDRPVKCEKCQGENTKRVFSGPTTFILEGTGWHRDQYTATRSRN